jgi:hypothetical protein
VIHLCDNGLVNGWIKRYISPASFSNADNCHNYLNILDIKINKYFQVVEHPYTLMFL